MLDPIIIGSIIVVGTTFLYKIGVLFYASKCKIFKCNLKEGLTIVRDTKNEQSIRHLDESKIDLQK
jgi:hypothetical protein